MELLKDHIDCCNEVTGRTNGLAIFNRHGQEDLALSCEFDGALCVDLAEVRESLNRHTNSVLITERHQVCDLLEQSLLQDMLIHVVRAKELLQLDLLEVFVAGASALVPNQVLIELDTFQAHQDFNHLHEDVDKALLLAVEEALARRQPLHEPEDAHLKQHAGVVFVELLGYQLIDKVDGVLLVGLHERLAQLT